MAIQAFALLNKNPQSFFCLCGQCILIATGELVVRSLVRHQRRLVHHDRQSPEHGEIGFHLRIAVTGLLRAGPPFRQKRFTNQLRIGGLRKVQSAPRSIPVDTQNAVICRDQLL